MALYGHESACQDIDGLTEYVLQLFEKMGFAKKQIKAGFVEGGNENDRYHYPMKTVSFTRFIKLVKERNYKGLSAFRLSIDNPKPSLFNDDIVNFFINFKGYGKTDISITIEKSIIADSVPELIEWSKQIYTFFYYHYGIIYEGKNSQATSSYLAGWYKHSFFSISQGKEGMLWEQTRHQTEQGYFRDVYQWNLLNKNHLDILLDGKTLAQHIQDSPTQWGVLQALNQHIWLWTLSEKQIKTVKKILLTHNRILIVT